MTDAVVAVIVMESSMQGAALLGSFSPLHSAFPLDAEAEYTRQEAHVLDRLGLFHLRRSSPRGRAEARSEPSLGQAAAATAAAASSLSHGHALGDDTAISPSRPISSSVEQPGHAGHALLSQRPHRPRARYVYIRQSPGAAWTGSCMLTPFVFLLIYFGHAPPSCLAIVPDSHGRVLRATRLIMNRLWLPLCEVSALEATKAAAAGATEGGVAEGARLRRAHTAGKRVQIPSFQTIATRMAALQRI